MKIKFCGRESGIMKRIARAIGMCAALIAAPLLVSAQDRPGHVFADAEETIVTVLGVNMGTRMVTVKTVDGRIENVKVPPEAYNLGLVRPGDQYRVRTMQSISIEVVDTPGRKTGAEVSSLVDRSDPGDTPGVEVANTIQVTVLVERIDYDTRKVVVSTANEIREITAGPEVKRLNEVKVGDMVQLLLTRSITLVKIEQ